MIFVLSLGTLFVISIPSIQTHLANRFTKKINKNFETNFKVDGVAIGFDGSVNLASFFVADHHSDTLFYAKNFKTDLYSLSQWVSGNLFFSSTDFEEIYFKITQYKGEDKNSLFQFTDKLLAHSNPQTNRPVFVKIDKLNVTDGRFLMINKDSFDKSLEFDKINFQANDFYILNSGLEVALKKMNFYSNDFGKVNLSNTVLNLNPCEIDLRSFQLSSGDSQIVGNVNLSLPDAGFHRFRERAYFDMNLNGFFSRQLLNNFIDLAEDFQPVKFSILAKGSPNEIQFSNFEIEQDVIQIKSRINLKDAFSEASMKAIVELSSMTVITNKLAQIIPSKHFNQFTEPLLRYDPFECKGIFSLEENQLISDLQLFYGNGSILSKGLFDLFSDEGEFKINHFEIKSFLKKFDLSPWHSKLGSGTSQLLITGNRGVRGNMNIDFDVDVDEFLFDNEKINKLEIEGALKEKEFITKIIVDDEYVVASSDLLYSWEKNQHKYQFDLSLDQLNLHHFSNELGGGKAIYSGDLNLYLVGNSFDDLQGNLLFKNIKFENINKVDSFNDFILETSLSDQKRIIKTINSEIMEINVAGKFQLSKLNSLFYNAISEAFPFAPMKKIDNAQDLVYDIIVQTDHLNAVFPDLVIDKKAVLKGVLSTQENISKMTLNIPKIAFKGISTENLAIQLDNQNPLYNTYVSVGKIESDSYEISEFNTLGVKIGDNLNFITEFHGRKSKEGDYKLNYLLKLDEEKSKILLKPSTIKLDRNIWTINPLNDQKHLISYDFVDQRIDLNFFLAQSANERIEISGYYQSAENFGLLLDIEKVSLENLGIPSKDFDFEGAMDLNLTIKRSPTDNTLKFNGFVDNFAVNDLDMGSLQFFTSGNTQLNSYEVNLILSKEGKSTLSAMGNILRFDQSPRLDLDFTFNDFDLSFLTPVGGTNIDHIRGNVSGNMNLWGALDAPKHNGQLILNNGGLSVPYINTDYRFSDGTLVTLVDQSFNFNNTILSDTRFGTQAELMGEINHVNFSDWGFDLNVASERILMLNIPEDDDEVFFGDGFLAGKVHLYGPSKNLTIDVVGATEEGTSIKIPWADDYGLADTSFVRFIHKKKINKTQKQNNEEFLSFSGLEMNFELDVNNNAEIKVVIDKESGSFLSGRGAGNILMEIDTNGKFNMWGDFITYNGIYNFKNLSVIDKKFNVKHGGTIVWEGNPLGAQMDLEAVYNVPGGANPAILLDNPNFNRKIPTEVLIRLQGNLLKPDDPIFEIEFPNTSAVVTSEINYRLADPQTSQLQALSLLSQGMFINEVSVSVQGITNNLYEKASDLFSNLMGNDNGKLQVGLNYLQGDKSRVMDINSEDRLGLTLSTQITDKILLNGKIGVPVGGIEETLIVGDLQIDFILNEEGSLKAKVFNKENEFRYIGDELGYTQGLGLSYQVDFETFRELIKKIIKGSQFSQSTNIEPLVREPFDAGVNFINKN